MTNFLNNISTKNYLFWFGSGLLLGGAFLHPLLWWTAIFGVWLTVNNVLREGVSFRQIVTGTILMGTTQFCLVLSWGWNIFPIEEFAMSSSLQLLAIFVTWIFSAFALGAGKILFTIPLFYYKRTYTVLLAGLWIVSDLVGALLFSFVTFGPGGTVNMNLSFGWLGYLLSEHALLLPLSYIGGVFILTFMYVSLALACRAYWESGLRNKRYLLSGVLAVFLLTSFLPLFDRHYDTSVSVATVETEMPSILALTGSDRSTYGRELVGKVRELSQAGYDYIILPEDAQFTSFFATSTDVLTFLQDSSPRDVVLIDSQSYKHAENEWYVRGYIYDTKTMKVYEQDKQYLVPQGEQVPYGFVFLMRLFGFGESATYFQSQFNYAPGVKERDPNWPAHLPGLLFCSDSFKPWGVWILSRKYDIPFVAHTVSHSWFHEPYILWNQLDQMLQVNTRFGNTVVYQASNMYEAKRY